jgi:peptidoglycan/xylan/chitin deacetylase (PgdA/CDA1 family)
LTAQTPAQILPLRLLLQHQLKYEATKLLWLTRLPLAITSAQGVLEVDSGVILVQTRALKTIVAASPRTYAYVISQDGKFFGLVESQALERAATILSDQDQAAMWHNSAFLTFLNKALPGLGQLHHKISFNRNAGAHQLRGIKKGIAITVDMCPGFKPLEDAFFQDLVELGKARGKPIPITLFLSGRWVSSSFKARPKDIEKLREWNDRGELVMTYGNHSYSHPYQFGRVPLERDFLMTPGVDLQNEVLTTEQAMMKKGFMPAPFFRFPGLISNQRMEDDLRQKYLMMNVGSGSWPATGQAIKIGDVVLVHGNGGEPKGVRLLRRWLNKHRNEIIKGDLEILPLTNIIEAP